MRLRNYLIAVRDIERSRQFYQELFDMTVLKDFGDNVILAGGLVLQERSQWEQLTGKESVPGYDGELFFETGNLDGFLQKLLKVLIFLLAELLKVLMEFVKLLLRVEVKLMLSVNIL